MPLPKAFKGVLVAAEATLVEASVHAAAQLVLHITGSQRLSREQVERYKDILMELTRVAKEDSDTRLT